jgi:stringent starvation protein B
MAVIVMAVIVMAVLAVMVVGQGSGMMFKPQHHS